MLFQKLKIICLWDGKKLLKAVFLKPKGPKYWMFLQKLVMFVFNIYYQASFFILMGWNNFLKVIVVPILGIEDQIRVPICLPWSLACLLSMFKSWCHDTCFLKMIYS